MGAEEAIYFLVVLFWPKVTWWALAAGRWGCLVFFVIRVTPPFSAGITPTAYALISIVSNVTYVRNSAYLVVYESGLLCPN
jgi:hypothetical protein